MQRPRTTEQAQAAPPLFAVPIILVMVAVTVLFSGCQGLFFYPSAEHYWDPADAGLVYQDVFFEAPDGTRLHGWFLPARTEEPLGSVFFVHGNAQNVSTHVTAVWWLPREGFNVFMFDYRGFGRSQGRPTFDGVHLDTEAAMETATTMADIDPERLIVFGQSLGASVAITTVARRKDMIMPAGLIAESPFASYRGITREKLAGFWPTWALQHPLSWLISDEYAPVDSIAELSPIPLLLIVAEDDRTIPPHHGELLFEAAGEPRHLWRIEGARHNQPLADPDVRRRFVETMRGWLGGDLDAASLPPAGPWQPQPPQP